MRLIPILVLLAVCTTAYGQSSLSEKEKYLAWLDSMKSETYIAIELTLDELEVLGSKEKDQLLRNKQRFNLNNTDEFLHRMPGLAMVRRGNFAHEPMLRGLTSERYAVSIDDMRVFGACTDKMDPVSSYIEPINLRSLDVSFGAQSNGIGASTGGGVNFNLKKPVFNADKPLFANIGMLYGSNANTFNQSFDVNYSTKKFAVRVSGVHRDATNYSDGNNDEVRYSQYEKYNHAASLSYRINDVSLLMLDYVGDNAYNVGYPALPMDVSSAKAKMFGITYIAPEWKFLKSPEIKFYHNFIKHVMDDTKRDSVAMHMDMPGETETTGAYLKSDLWHDGKHNLSFKLDYYKTIAYADMTMYPNDSEFAEMFMLTWPDINRNVTGLEFNHGFQLNNNFKWSNSTRIEYGNTFITNDFGERQLSVFNKTGMNDHEEILINASTRIALSKSEGATSELSLSYGERLPSTSEQFGFYLFNRQDGFDYLGDPDLKKEKNIHIEFNQGIEREKFKLKGAVFSYFFNDYIMGIYDPTLSNMTIGALGVKWYENVGRATMFGGELSSNYQFSDNLSLAADVKYVYGEDFEADPLPQMPPLKVNVSLDKEWKGFYIHPEMEWSAAQNRISEKFNENTTPDYFLIHMKVYKEFELGQTQLRLTTGVENITNTVYREHFDIGTLLRPGRNAFVQMQVRF